MHAILVILTFLNLAAGFMHVWGLTYVPEDQIARAITMPENLFYLACTAAFFLVPAIGWTLWKRAPGYLPVAIVALPVLVFALTADFNFRVVAS